MSDPSGVMLTSFSTAFPLTFPLRSATMIAVEGRKGVFPMADEYDSILLTLEDDDGQLHEFELIDELEIDEGRFVALVPTVENPADAAAGIQSYIILQVVDDDGEDAYERVEDDALLRRLADEFEDRFNEFYFGEEDDED